MECHVLWQWRAPASAGEALGRDLGQRELGATPGGVESDQDELPVVTALDDLAERVRGAGDANPASGT